MKTYFPGLNGIRAIAAFIVIVFHINANMWFFGSRPIAYLEQRDEMSRHAVVLFFVLSGFLITYLLMKEKQWCARIDIKKFYLRRIFRIWPLFYAALFLAIIVIPFRNFHHPVSYNFQTVGLYALFIPNFALMAGYMLPTIAPLWSVGVEEQFYAIWPLMLNKFKSTIGFLICFLIGYLLLKVILLATGNVYSPFSINLVFFSYDTMAIGGIAAWLFATNHKMLTWLYHPIIQTGCWLFFIVSCIKGPLEIAYIVNKELYAIVFAIIILNVATNPKTVIKLNGRISNYLGKISYGMYVLHPFIIVLCSFLFGNVIAAIKGKPLQLLAITAAVIPLTILAADFSFRFFESRFLKMKLRYDAVKAGEIQKRRSSQEVLIAN